MAGSVELSGDGTRLVITFPYRPHLVAVVKDLPSRRWNPQEKEWHVPSEHAAETVQTLKVHGFVFAKDVLSLAGDSSAAAPTGSDDLTAGSEDLTGGLPFGDLADITAPATSQAKETSPGVQPGRDPAGDSAGEPVEGLRIAELNHQVAAALRGAFPTALWVIGEVVDHDRRAGKRFLMFKLVDKPDPKSDPDAEVDVVMFPDTRSQVARRLEEAGLTLQDGVEIRAQVRVDIWEKAGRFRLVIEDIDPAFTLGMMQLSRQQILKSLREKGFDRLQPALAIPDLPLRIGVLSSPDADGYHDFLRTLQQAERGFDVTLHPTNVQGERMQGQMLKGLSWFAEHAADFDVLCIMRGGGSRTDLAWFDNLEIAEAVAKHPLPILCGIGHERDRSVLDEIARTEKTPTAVAERLKAWVDEAEDRTAEQTERLQDLVDRRLTTARDQLRALAERARHATHKRLGLERETLAVAASRVGGAAHSLVRDARGDLQRTFTSITTAVDRRLDTARERVAAHGGRLQRSAPRQVTTARQQLDAMATRLRLLDPTRVVQRGYALLQDNTGRVIPSAQGIQPGDGIRVRLRDGTLHGTVDEVTADSDGTHSDNNQP